MTEPVETVVVCDSEPIAIEGLRSLLESAEGLRVVAAETSLADGMEAVRELRPSIVILDKALGLQNVIDCLQSLRESGSSPATIAWGVSLSDAETMRLLQAGAAGVVRKTVPLDVLMKCILAVAVGGTWMEHSLLRTPDWPIPSGRSLLTAREMQVMELVERGLKNKDIAAMLGIRTGTVKIHLKHIFEKTGIRGRYGLALSGLKEKGLLSAVAAGPM